MRIATIDIGTNTTQLLVTESTGTGLVRVDAAEGFVRLGEGVDARGRIESAAQDRLLDTLHEYVERAHAHEADLCSVAGTSVLRDATNREAVLQTVQDEVGISIEILSGDEEAAWSFAAACAPFDSLTGPCLVVDIGGGSTELVAGEDPAECRPHVPNAITARSSLDVGCVRLTERCFSSQPPTPNEINRTKRLIDKALAAQTLDVGTVPTLIGTAGTATALARVHAGPDHTWDALHGNGFTLTRDDVGRWKQRLFQLSEEEIQALHPEAMEGRADVFPVGVLLLNRIMDCFAQETLRISPYELRHGLALRVLADRESGQPH